MPLPDLPADQLHVAVFGPGVGELVAVRAPPGHWLIVDGCGPTTRSYGQRLLAHYKARPSLIAFTHPHADHASGMAEIIEDATSGPASSWPPIGMLWPSPRTDGDFRDLQAVFSSGVVEDALAAIGDRWEREPRCRWELRAGLQRMLGEARVFVRSPSHAEARAAFAAWRRREGWNPNRIATVLEVEWRDQRILLGSDLDEGDGGGWSEVARRGHVQPGHLATKTPHHGSRGALHDIWLQPSGSREPVFIVTPFARENLPRFGSGEGIQEMHRHAAQVHLTALPRRHDRQAGTTRRVLRRQLEALGKSSRDAVPPGWPDCFVIASISHRGKVRLHHGPGSVSVLRDPPSRRVTPLVKGRRRKARGRS